MSENEVNRRAYFTNAMLLKTLTTCHAKTEINVVMGCDLDGYAPKFRAIKVSRTNVYFHMIKNHQRQFCFALAT